MVRTLSVLWSILVLVACSPKKTESLHYEPFPEPSRQQSYRAQIFNNTYAFTYPSNMILTDSLLIVQDNVNQEYAYHAFSRKTGDFLYSFGRKGRGPGEIITPGDMVTIDNRNHLLVTWDANRKKQVRYRLPGHTGDSIFFDSESTILSTKGYNISDIMANNGEYYAIGYIYPLRFGKLDKDSIRLLYSDYPQLTEDDEANRSVWNYVSLVRMSPKGDRIVAATYVGTALEILSVRQDSIQSQRIRAVNPPIFRIVDGVKPKWVGLIDETIIGFIDIRVSDRFIYANLSNQPLTEEGCDGSESIWIFDWDANPAGKMNLDRYIETFCVDEADGTVYAASIDQSSGEYELVKFSFDPNDFSE